MSDSESTETPIFGRITLNTPPFSTVTGETVNQNRHALSFRDRDKGAHFALLGPTSACKSAFVTNALIEPVKELLS